MKELLLGCGHSRTKRMFLPDGVREWENLFTVDMNRACRPTYVQNLNSVRWDCIKENEFDEIHAYEVLEHLGSQGDELSFFRTFVNIYNLLLPGGHLFASVPSRFGPWLWGDPGHRRAILPESLTFLDQTLYAEECGVTTRTDYRDIYKADFKTISTIDNKITHSFILQAVKPSRGLK